MGKWMPLATMLFLSWSPEARADLFDDAVRVGMRYRQTGREQGTMWVPAGGDRPVATGGTFVVEPTSTLAALGQYLDPSKRVRVCWIVDSADPPLDYGDRRSIPSGFPAGSKRKSKPAGLWGQTSCARAEQVAAELTADSRSPSRLFGPTALLFGDKVMVEVWFPLRSDVLDATQAAVLVNAREEHGSPRDGAWIKVMFTALVWDWDRHALFAHDADDAYRHVIEAEADAPVRLAMGEAVVIGLPDAQVRDPRRRAAFVPPWDELFGMLCVNLVRTGAQDDESRTALEPRRMGEETDRSYSLRALPANEVASFEWGIRMDGADGEDACVRVRSHAIERRPVGPYATFPLVSEVVAAANELDPGDVRGTSTVGVTFSCGDECAAGALFPIVVSWNTRAATVSNYFAIFLGPMFTAATETDDEGNDSTVLHLRIAGGVRLLNSLMLGADVDVHDGLFHFLVGGDVPGLGDLVLRLTG